MRVTNRIHRLVSFALLVFSSWLPVWAQSYNEILAVSPDSGPQAASGLLITFTLATDVPPAPPAGVLPLSVTLGTMAGNAFSHPDQYTVTATFTIPAGETLGAKDAAITFSTPNGTLIYSLAGAFTVTASDGSGGGDEEAPPEPGIGTYPVVDTGQTGTYSTAVAIAPPAPGGAFTGQDSQYAGHTPSYSLGGDGLTVLDPRTGLTWTRSPDLNNDGVINASDNLTHAAATAYPASLQALNFGGYNDWRLPNAKELQSILDYTRAPGITASAAIDPVFACSAITNEAGALDYPWYWTSTTHINYTVNPGTYAAYVCFGRALGYMNGSWQDVHGAGCQRSDPKGGSLSDWTCAASGYYSSQAPQGDAIRIFNFVRAVRGGAEPPATDTDGDSIPDWTEYDYVTNTIGLSATGDLDGDGMPNTDELAAGTSPFDAESLLHITELNGHLVWPSVLGKNYRVEISTNLLTGAFIPLASGILAEPPANQLALIDTLRDAGSACFRITLE